MSKSIRVRTLAFMLACVSLCMMFSVSSSAVVHAHASEIATPYYNDLVTTDTAAVISSSGKLTARYSYDGAKDDITKAVITTYVEKKVLGLFWTRVDIGTTDNEWIDTIYDYAHTGSHSTQLTSEGTYRVTFEFVIYGTDGSTDEITREKELEY